MMFEVTCVGILCADVLAKPVNKLPEKGRLELFDQLQLQIGGCAANAAVDLAKIGIQTAIIGKIGQDGFGKFLCETLKAENVDIRGLRIDGSMPTSASIVAIDSGGERSILHCLGSNSIFSYNDINIEIVKKSKILFIAGTFLMPKFDGTGAEKLLKEAKKAGVLCCMDTAWDSTGKWMEKIQNSLQYLDWFMPSCEEARELAGKDSPEEMADIFFTKGVRNVVIKLGKDGCFVKLENGDSFYSPAFDCIEVVDASGAGDSFCAGFIAGLLRGWEIYRCARFANAAGSLCVTAIGTTAGIRSMDEILDFMKKH